MTLSVARLIAVLSFSLPLLGGFVPTTEASEKLDIWGTILKVDAIHPSVVAKRTEIIAAESNRSAAWQQLLPSFSATRTQSNAVSNGQITTARLQQPIFSGGRITAGIDQADAGLDETQAALLKIRRDLTNRTATVYIDVVKARARLAVADKSVATHDELLASIDRRVGAEVSPESDRILTQSRLAQAQSERSQVALSLRLAEDNLRELLADDLPEFIAPGRPQEVEELTQALDQGIRFSPELRQLSAQEESAKSEVQIQRSAIFPTLYLRHDQLSGDHGVLPKSQTYLGVEFVPGAGASAGSKIRAAEQRRLAAIDTRRATEKDVRDQIRSLWAEREALRAQVQSALAYVQSAQSVAESFSRQFTIGRKTWVEVLNAKREALLAELSHTEIAWNALRASYQLEIQIGRLTPDQIAGGRPSQPNRPQ